MALLQIASIRRVRKQKEIWTDHLTLLRVCVIYSRSVKTLTYIMYAATTGEEHLSLLRENLEFVAVVEAAMKDDFRTMMRGEAWSDWGALSKSMREAGESWENTPRDFRLFQEKNSRKAYEAAWKNIVYIENHLLDSFPSRDRTLFRLLKEQLSKFSKEIFQ